MTTLNKGIPQEEQDRLTRMFRDPVALEQLDLIYEEQVEAALRDFKLLLKNLVDQNDLIGVIYALRYGELCLDAGALLCGIAEIKASPGKVH